MGVTADTRSQRQTQRQRMDLTRVLAVALTLTLTLWTSRGAAAPTECHFNSRGREHRHVFHSDLTGTQRLTFDLQHCVCSRGETSPWARPGWTTAACSAPVCTRSASAAARREYGQDEVCCSCRGCEGFEAGETGIRPTAASVTTQGKTALDYNRFFYVCV